MKRFLSSVLAAALLLTLAACSAKPEKASSKVFAMDTVMSLEVYGKGAEEALHDAVERIYHYDNLLSPPKRTATYRK